MARLLEEWEARIGLLEVVPGKGGIFDVHMDGELVFTKSMIGRSRNRTTSMPLLRERLEGG